LAWVAVAVGLLVCASVLFPVFFHHWSSVSAPSSGTVADLRRVPVDDLLLAVASQVPIGPRLPSPADAVLRASDSVRVGPDGRLQAVAAAPVTPASLVSGDPLASLAFSSFAHVDALLVAHQATRQDAYLVAARDQLLAYARYERHAWLQRGFLWNDHAIAARVGVVIRFWAVYRSHPSFDEAVAAELLLHVRRCVDLLAAPAHFTAWSNHGVMQNVALLQAAAVFPGLIDAPTVRQLALARLSSQWRYYLSEEGVVLEHSAGYHLEGVLLLRSALELLRMLDLPIPAAWPAQLMRAEQFLTLLTRPDGTLPAYGDTRYELHGYAGTPRPAVGMQAQQLDLYPVSGYGVLRGTDVDGAVGSHTVLTWSHFPGQAHKQADELGMLLWAAGRSWLTSTGYAPYGTPYRAPVEGWLGSNAPHGQQEALDPARSSRLQATAVAGPVSLVDLERAGPAGARMRRQVLSLGGQHWIVLDFGNGPDAWGGLETLWTFPPDLALNAQSDDRFQVVSPAGEVMQVSFRAGPGAPLRVQPLKGRLDPFAGWVATTQAVVPAPSLRVQSGLRTWVATVFSLDRGAVLVSLSVDTQDRWQLGVGDWQVERTDATLRVVRAGGQQALSMVPGPDVRAAQQQVTASLQATVREFPKYRDLDLYRWRVAQFLLPAWLVQLAARGVLYGVRQPGWLRAWRRAFDVAAITAWLALAWWLHAVYFTR